MFKNYLLKSLLLLLPLCGLWQLAGASYIHSKAILAQVLLETAWLETLHDQQEVKPWSWADTWPVSRLRVPRLGIDRIVLAGASGSSLAFGPGHLFGSASPGDPGNTVIAGHRDTHFSFLKTINKGEIIQLQTIAGEILNYAVVETRIVHEDETAYLVNSQEQKLTLITCYPFDAIRPGGSLRYIVIAKQIPAAINT